MDNIMKYEMIENYLQEAVNNDIYTEDRANLILEMAYDNYIIESSNTSTSDIKERIKKNKKKIIALIAICTTSILIIHKIMKDKKTIESQKKSLKTMEKLFVEESKKCKELKSQVEELEVKAKRDEHRGDHYKRLYNIELRDNKKLKEKNENLKEDKERLAELVHDYRYKDRVVDNMEDEMRENNISRRYLAKKKDELIKNPDNKNLMKQIIEVEKEIKDTEKNINKYRNELKCTDTANHYAYKGIKTEIDETNKKRNRKIDNVKLD